jgi:hypothetical protein
MLHENSMPGVNDANKNNNNEIDIITYNLEAREWCYEKK